MHFRHGGGMVMRLRRSNTSLRARRAGSEFLSLALATLLLLTPVGFASPLGAGPPWKSGAPAVITPFAQLAAAIEVNTTGDGDNVDANVACDADAATTGEQCTLRAAIQRANALAGDDHITFNIPSSQPNCDTATGQCIINLTKALPDLSSGLVIEGESADLLTVRRDTGGDYRIFNVTTTGGVTFADIGIENG